MIALKILVRKKVESHFFIDFLLGLCFLVVILGRIIDFPYSKVLIYGLFSFFTIGYSLKQSKTAKDLLSLFACLLVAGILYLVSGSVIFFLILMFGFSIRNNSFRHNAKIMFWSQAIFFSIIISLFFLFKFNYGSNLFPVDGSTRRIRYSLGFPHPNNAASFFFFILLSYYLYHKLTIKNLTVSFILSFIVFWLTDSRTFLLTVLFLYFCLFIHKILKNKFNFIYRIDVISFPLLTLLTLIMSIYFHDTKIDGLVSGRFNNTYNAMIMYPVPLFSQNKPLPILDNLFAFTLFNKGMIVWVCFALFLGIGVIRSKKSYIKKDFSIFAFCFLALMFYSMSEAEVIYSLNPVISLLTVSLVSNHKEIRVSSIEGTIIKAQ